MIRTEFLAPIRGWKKNGQFGFCIGADIGASGIRFQLSNPSNMEDIINHPHIKASSAQNVYQALENLESSLNRVVPGAKCFGSAFAIAGLRIGTDVCPNNWPGPDSARTIKTSLFTKSLYPPNRSILLNDLEAGAYGLVAASNNGKIGSYFQQLWGKKGPVIADSRTAIMAMGCGLGTAIIVNNENMKIPAVLSTEAGYLQANSVLNNHQNQSVEKNLVQFMSDYYYNGFLMPGYEDFSSGRGLCVTYQYLSGNIASSVSKNCQANHPNAAEIAEMAKNGDRIAIESMKTHYLLFTRCAKAIATTMQCESVVMALSNQVSNNWFVNTIIEDMKKEFFDTTKPEWLNRTRVYSQKKDLNFNMIGTTYMAHYYSNSI